MFFWFIRIISKGEIVIKNRVLFLKKNKNDSILSRRLFYYFLDESHNPTVILLLHYLPAVYNIWWVRRRFIYYSDNFGCYFLYWYTINLFDSLHWWNIFLKNIYIRYCYTLFKNMVYLWFTINFSLDLIRNR